MGNVGGTTASSRRPNWGVGETFFIGSGESFRIVEIRTGLASEMINSGLNGVFVVEPICEPTI